MLRDRVVVGVAMVERRRGRPVVLPHVHLNLRRAAYCVVRHSALQAAALVVLVLPPVSPTGANCGYSRLVVVWFAMVVLVFSQQQLRQQMLQRQVVINRVIGLFE